MTTTRPCARLARRLPDRADDTGGAIILVLVLGTLLLSFASIIVQRTGNEARQSSQAAEYSAALHAAEAGVNDYIAKVTEDHLYYGHLVHPAEDQRTRTIGGVVAPGQTWPGDPTWTYAPADRRQTWRTVGSAGSDYEYNLAVSPPGGTTAAITVTATGRKRSNPKLTRSIEVQFQGTSVADFQMLSNASVSYGAVASTNGKVYSLADVDHDGTANAGVYAEGDITGSGTFNDQRCDGNGTPGGCFIRDAIKTPVSFSSFAGSLTEVQRASQSVSGGGIYLPTTSGVDAWRLTLNAGGTIGIEKCTGSNVASTTPTCTAYLTRNVPSIGAVYATQAVIVRGTLKGRVTIVSNDNIVIADNISYTNGQQDVLGLIAERNIYIAQYVPNTITWRAAVIARTGAYKLWDCNGSTKNGTYTHVGAVATYGGGCMSAFTTRVYTYDDNLKFLQPPFFPVLEEAYRILRFREVG
jgi:hypothetical protein